MLIHILSECSTFLRIKHKIVSIITLSQGDFCGSLGVQLRLQYDQPAPYYGFGCFSLLLTTLQHQILREDYPLFVFHCFILFTNIIWKGFDKEIR